MVAPNGLPEPEGTEDFPLVETFQDCCGETRRFEVSLNITDGGFFLRAAEIKEGGDGHKFAAHHPASPYVAMGILRHRIAAGLATRYLVTGEHGRHLGHDYARGHIGYGCVVIDGKEISFDEFNAMLQSYEGWRFELRIADGFDVY